MPQPPAHAPRFASLDGLRGVAALIVVLHHLSMTVPSIALTYYPAASTLPAGSLLWWLSNTPLKLLTAGTEGVLVFFVLSGFVLGLTPLRDRDFDWIGYYPRRIVRLYLPTLAALALACVVALVPRDASAFSGPFLHGLADVELSFGGIVRDATILFGSPFLINPPMWSLVWEVWFSLLLPAFLAIALLLKRWWLTVAVGIALTALGAGTGQEWLSYLPIFLVGVGLAQGVDTLRALAAWVDRRAAANAIWGVLFLVGVLALLAGWLWRGGHLRTESDAVIQLPLGVLGAAAITVVCMFSPGARRVLTWTPVAWLGRISFSLYLVHLPVILGTAYLLGEHRWPITVAIALPVSLGLAQLFYVAVEKPSHRLSRSLRLVRVD